jgi:UDP-N-acetylglucosamine pyrophosphorylase
MSLADRLAAAGQEHLVAALEGLDGPARRRLEEQIAALDLELVARLVADDAVHDPGLVEPLSPEDVIPLPRDDADRARERAAREAGEAALASGRLAAVLLAGGQGTRLGFDGPKGAFPVGPITGATLFAHHAAKIAALRARYGAAIPWLVLTSPQNDAVTRELFAANDHYGVPADSVRFVVQGTLPAVDRRDGTILLEAPDRLALSPDGHGGLLSALRASGALDELSDAGVETIFTFQVDNPMLSVCRPDVIGHHLDAGADMSSMVVRKLGP